MTIKTHKQNKGHTIICTFTSWYYIIDQKIIQNSQVVKKKLNLKNQDILLVEAFLVHNSRTKILPDMPFSQNDSPEQYLKKHFQRNLMIKHLKKFKNFITTLTHENQNPAKKSGCHFYSLSIP